MRLNKGQKEKLLEWVAEGLQSDEINKRAALFDPPFSVGRSQVRFYRVTRGTSLKALAQASEFDALNSGLALKSVRVQRLQVLAGMLEDDLFDGLTWTTDVKAVGVEKVYIDRFNQAEVSEYRATLDQIASEVGDKKPDQIVPSEITVRFVKPDAKDA